MRKIEIVEKPCDEAIYEIDKFAFKFCDNDVGHMIKYQVDLEIKGSQPIDVRLLLQDMDSELEFLLPAPEEVTKLINEVDEKNDPSDECLFHDLRTKYIEFIKCATDTSTNIKEEIILLGFSLHDEKIYLVMKTFSFNVLAEFWEKLISYCTSKSIMFNVPDDIRWIKLQQYLLQTNETKASGFARDFLARTLVDNNFTRFKEIFQHIDADGYFGKTVYNKVMFQNIKVGKEEKTVPVNQVNKFFAPYWKYPISTAEKNKTVLCLHDEMPSDETVEEYVYTFKPSLMKYYLQSWFEDFTVEIIKKIKFDGVRLRQILAGKKFNFFLDGSDDSVREIDAVIELEKDGIVKLIAIECKKTLSDKEIKATNRKCREKVIDSGNNVFDAFIHIGCFNKDVVFDKKIEGTRKKYKQSLIEGTGEKMDVPYYAFVISSIEDYEIKLKHIIDDIFVNW